MNYPRAVFAKQMAKLPANEIMVSVICTMVKMPILNRFTHMDVHALLQKFSPVKDAWMKPYLVNCWQIFSISHAMQFSIP